jgi:hypothetical protein
MTKSPNSPSPKPNSKLSHLSQSASKANVASLNVNVASLKVKPSHAKSYETIAKISVNMMFIATVIAGLAKLIPEQSIQLSRLNDLNAEVAAREKTVSCLREQFSQSFDLGNSQTASLRDKGLIKVTQRPIRFINDVAPTDAKESNSEPKRCS